MKTSTKITTFLIAMSTLAFNAKAQTTFSTTTVNSIRYSVGVESGLPAGGFHAGYNWNLGGSIQADIPLANQLYGTGNAGYNNFFSKNAQGISEPDFQLLPVKAGLKYFPISNLYVQGEAGAAFALNKSGAGIDRTAAFIYAPQVGILIPLSSRNAIDAGIRYERSTSFDSAINNSKLNYFGLRVAYAFDL